MAYKDKASCGSSPPCVTICDFCRALLPKEYFKEHTNCCHTNNLYVYISLKSQLFVLQNSTTKDFRRSLAQKMPQCIGLFLAEEPCKNRPFLRKRPSPRALSLPFALSHTHIHTHLVSQPAEHLCQRTHAFMWMRRVIDIKMWYRVAKTHRIP